MTVIPNQRKTYMMLSKQNAERYILDENGTIINEWPTRHTTKIMEEPGLQDIGDEHVVGYRNISNVMYTFRFPEAFVNSKNPRWVEIHHCKVLYSDAAVGDLVLHSDIVQRDPYLDHTIMNVNETRTKYKKYEYTQQKQYFTIWFTSFAHPNLQVLDRNLTFLCEMMLIY